MNDTIRYGLLGRKLGHSYSPQIHRMLGNSDYRLLPVEEDEVKRILVERNFIGLNVTIPYKETVMPYCDRLTERAKKIGSVNTLTFDKDGKLVGDNTDYYGFSYLLKKSGISVYQKKCLVLGSGGSSKTVLAVLADRGASQIVVISRNGEDNYENLSRHYDAQVIVNTTPVGMYPGNGESPVDLAKFPRLCGVLDLIYNPSRTALLQQAKALGIRCENGLPMLVAQAKAAHERFFDQSRGHSIIDRITVKLQKQMRNLTIVGMPGCGKSTVARQLSKMTGRAVVDTDKIVEQMSGKKPADLIRNEGVDVLRMWETKALKSVAYQSGLIIATGGGIVTVPENLPILRENSTVVFLNRPNEYLSSYNRPLSSTPEAIEKLSKERLPLYRAVCDVEIKDTRSHKAFFSATPKKLKHFVK